MSDHDTIPCDYAREAYREGEQIIYHDDPEPAPDNSGVLLGRLIMALSGALVGGFIGWLVFAP